jgi:hypothetical protein
MLRVRFLPLHPDTVQKKIENALWSTQNKKNIMKKKILAFGSDWVESLSQTNHHLEPMAMLSFLV